MKDPILWSKIQNFQLDEPDVKFPFSKRLARDNNWSHEFAKDVIEEYKKFIYLCCTSTDPITPSDSVDQAWHLHLTYTKSYWKKFCGETLNREIHHNPTKGGNSERNKFSDFYDRTFELYNTEFGIDPPKHIWWNGKKRFKEIDFRRINMSQNWIIPKPTKSLRLSLGVITSAIIIFFLFVQAHDASGVVVIGFIILFVLVVLINSYSDDKDSKWFGCDNDFDSGCDSGCSGCGGCGDD